MAGWQENPCSQGTVSLGEKIITELRLTRSFPSCDTVLDPETIVISVTLADLMNPFLDNHLTSRAFKLWEPKTKKNRSIDFFRCDRITKYSVSLGQESHNAKYQFNGGCSMITDRSNRPYIVFPPWWILAFNLACIETICSFGIRISAHLFKRFPLNTLFPILLMEN